MTFSFASFHFCSRIIILVALFFFRFHLLSTNRYFNTFSFELNGFPSIFMEYSKLSLPLFHSLPISPSLRFWKVNSLYDYLTYLEAVLSFSSIYYVWNILLNKILKCVSALIKSILKVLVLLLSYLDAAKDVNFTLNVKKW